MTESPHGTAVSEVTRRELLEWLGGAAAVVLGADLAALSRAWAQGATPKEGGLAFRPGELSAARRAEWPVRTVDPPALAPLLAHWRLDVGGMVEAPRTCTFADLLELPRTDQVTDFHCVEGWSVYDVPWNGVSLAGLLETTKVASAATHVNFHTVGGAYNESVPLAVAREKRTLLAYGVGGVTLPLNHGFPLRLVVPRLLGYKNAKFVERIEVSDRPLRGFWVQAGYGYDGEVPKGRLREGKF